MSIRAISYYAFEQYFYYFFSKLKYIIGSSFLITKKCFLYFHFVFIVFFKIKLHPAHYTKKHPYTCIYQKKTLPLHGFCCFHRMNTQILKFTIFCISNIAERLQISARDVYHKMVQTDVISAYIIPCYDVLHSFSKEYIVEDLISYMRKKGVTL